MNKEQVEAAQHIATASGCECTITHSAYFDSYVLLVCNLDRTGTIVCDSLPGVGRAIRDVYRQAAERGIQ